jgi:acyl-CoA synthetase (AMP-forming)/AMP-acid ligase II
MPGPADPDRAALAGLNSLAELLRYRATVQPDERAYVVLSDRGREERAITFAALAGAAEALARRIAARVAPGDRALLLCPTGIDFMIGFFGCLLAGVIAVPIMLPRRNSARDASAAIAADCAPRLALAPEAVIAARGGELADRFAGCAVEWLAVGDCEDAEPSEPALQSAAGDGIAFLQYTSGSTAAPKGVMVSHANLLANLDMIRRACGNTRASTYVSWVPLYHDMGLITSALQTLYVGSLCVFLAPVAFIQRPLVWLRAISDYRAAVAGGPNFAFDLCVERCPPEQLDGLDLSCWKIAFNSAEPIRAETLRRFTERFAACGFSAASLYPAYGMAEATVMVSTGRPGAGAAIREFSRDGLARGRAVPPRDAADVQILVGSGRAIAPGRLAIVDPESSRRLGPDRIGEIWVAGPNVARGYWRNPAATEAVFGARPAGEAAEKESGGWLRSGDLGFLDPSSELFVTGRIKDVVIIRGTNHYPQDIEETVQRCHPALRPHGGAAFAAASGDDAERLVILQEVERTQRRRIAPDEIAGRIREAVISGHDIVPFDIVLLRPGALPLTTSGKIQRGLSRELWLAGALDRL